MPELPEVETTRRGIAPHIENRTITAIKSRVSKLRNIIEHSALETLIGQKIIHCKRRGKYLILQTNDPNQALLLHLGMSGSLRITTPSHPLKKHDHILITFDEHIQLRLHDPRRFGHFSLFNPHEPQPLLDHLGPEPLSETFTGEYLYHSTKNRKIALKAHIMNQNTVVGVGNIYATEALFHAGIRPGKAAKSLTKTQAALLTNFIKSELTRAIEQGGTTLKDFVSPDGSHGYFGQTLSIYGKAGQPCPKCNTTIKNTIIGNRASAYCPKCQT